MISKLNISFSFPYQVFFKELELIFIYMDKVLDEQLPILIKKGKSGLQHSCVISKEKDGSYIILIKPNIKNDFKDEKSLVITTATRFIKIFGIEILLDSNRKFTEIKTVSTSSKSTITGKKDIPFGREMKQVNQFGEKVLVTPAKSEHERLLKELKGRLVSFPSSNGKSNRYLYSYKI